MASRPSLHALRKLSTSLPTRSLSMTSSTTFPSPLLTTEHPINLRDTSKRPPPSPLPTRDFNTTRALKTPNDTSPIDFTYIPSLDPSPPSSFLGRVPLLHTAAPNITNGYAATTEDAVEVMRPTISTTSSPSTHFSAPSAMHEVHDNGAAEIDFQGLAERITQRLVGETGVGGVGTGEGEVGEASVVRRVWNDMLDDVFGEKNGGRG
ncbi:hypothetical protein M501DRAFT_990792 [Patellaria atrata CBS 101060]|uniref:Uncharacterized protein n=1 Tax=Patellaria atrata CBS 101060 TaxID=1346257 RepID=A0A9P4SFV7_9PEZI|nr:hypothetical protein M501DRAFT_990792 [Patellaria atrata CBS 101060]